MIKNIGIDMGHALSGAGSGAHGVVSETTKNREVGKKLISMLTEKGYNVVNCTVDKAGSQKEQLAGIVKKEKAQKLDLFLSLHLNAYSGTDGERGVETYSLSTTGTGREYAGKVQKELVTAIGWKDRGIKTDNFYVLRNTVAPAVLVELGFCDAKGDMDKWNTDKIAKALFKAITGTTYAPPAPVTTPDDVIFRVVCGSYAVRANAEALQKKLKDAGFDSFLVADHV